MATTTLPETEVEMTTSPKNEVKYVYFFGGGKADGNGKMKDVLGGKGAGLAEMTNAGLPVPPGFTIQTEACREFMRHNAVSKEVDRQMDEALKHLEQLQGQKLGQGLNQGEYDRLKKRHECVDVLCRGLGSRPSRRRTAHRFFDNSGL